MDSKNKLRLIIDLGHGGKNTGCIHNGIVESRWLWDELGCHLFLFEPLFRKHIDIFLTRIGNQTITLSERHEYAREMKPDAYISLHVNAHQFPYVHGGTFFYWPDANGLSHELAYEMSTRQPKEFMRDKYTLFKAEDLPDNDRDNWLERPINVLKDIDCCSCRVLYEICYASNATDAKTLDTCHCKTDILSTVIHGLATTMRMKTDGRL